MILYHGTTSLYKADILENGIKCRRKRKSLWDEHPSCRDRVYLTRSYAVHFARHASITRGGNPMIIEVDTFGLLDNLVPDEDVMAQTNWRDVPETHEMNMKEKTEYWAKRTHDMSDWAGYSLDTLGTVAHMGDIPAWSIISYLELPKSHPAIFGHDPSISIINYKMLGNAYNQALKALMSSDGAEGHSPHLYDGWSNQDNQTPTVVA